MREGYKETVIGEIPKEWDVVKLGDVAILTMGQSPSSTFYNNKGIGLPLIQGNADIKKRSTYPRIWAKEFSKICNKGDIIMTVRAPVGSIALSNHKAAIGRGVCAINPRYIHKSFLYQNMILNETNWGKIEQGSTFTAVNGNEIKRLQIPLPPLPEQKKIASILTTVDQKLEVIEQQITETGKLKKGLMQRLLTRGIGHTAFKDSPLGEIPKSWKVVKVGYTCKLLGGYAFKSSDTQEEGIRWLKITNVGIKKVFWDNISFLPEDFAEKHPDFILNEGDIIIAMTRPILNERLKIAIIKKEDQGALLNQRVGRIILSEPICNDFAFQIFNFHSFILSLKKELLGTDPPNISSNLFESLKIPLPPLPEQKEIASILSTVDQKLEVLQEKKAAYGELKKGLMQQLLTGKIRTLIPVETQNLASN